ncbi:MAG: DUF4384 domain-containing protein [Thermostichales cyanobacterium SZTDM-1c_bins_54]
MSFPIRWSALVAGAVLVAPTVAWARPFEARPVAPVAPRSIVVEPVLPQPLNPVLHVWLNRPGHNPAYRPGEAISISVQPNRDAYIYLYSVEANGQVRLIIPNSYAQAATFVRGGQVFTFPPPGAAFRLTVTPPYGQAAVFALASPRPLNTQEISFLERPGHISRLSRGRRPQPPLIHVQPYSTPTVQRIQVDPVVPEQSWMTGTAFYQVSF